jgi:hypothetical protein
MQCERNECARAVLAARFQGTRLAREASDVGELPRDADALVVGLMACEYDGSWRESWTRNSAAGALKHALRLTAASRVPWLVIEARGRLLQRGADAQEPPLIHEFTAELERMGYKWAHRTVASACFGIPDVAARVILVASRHADPRDVLFTEDAGEAGVPRRSAEETEHTFIFNHHAERGFSVYADVCEGFNPEPNACVLTAAGGLMPLAVHDGERLQGLPPGWTMTTRPNIHGSQGLELLARWEALAVTHGCVSCSYWLGNRLADSCALKYLKNGTPFREAVPPNWPGSAYNVGHGRVIAPCSPIVYAISELPTLGTFISTSFFEGGPLVPEDVAIECTRAMKAAGWEPPPQLLALEHGGSAGVKNEAVNEGGMATPAANIPLVQRTLPLIRTKSGSLQQVESDELRPTTGDVSEAKRLKRERTPTTPDTGSPGSSTPTHMSYIAGVGLASRRKNQLVWAKLPGHPFWPGMRVNLETDFIPDDARKMARDQEVLVVFFGENSFGWVREEHCLDFKEHYSSKSRDPSRNKARFQAAVKQANDEQTMRETLQERDKLRKQAAQAHLHKFASSRARGRSPIPELKGCACRSCTSVPTDGSAAPKCIRLQAADKASKGHIGAKLTIQGKTIIGKRIFVFWPLDKASYPGTVVDYDPYELRHKVEYAEDGVKEFLSLWKEDVTIPAGETLGPTHPEADEAGADLLMGLMTGA